MRLLCEEISRAKLKPGDHIYSWRTLYIYAHHGIYDGEGNVIHFTNPTGGGSGISSVSSSSATGSRCPRCGYHSGLGGVISSCIDCFLEGNELCLFEYGVSRPYFLSKVRGGTCTIASSDSPEDVLHRARYLLKHGFGDYGLFKKNCEDFAIYCKTGRILIGDPLGNRIGETVVLSGVTFLALGFVALPLAISYSRLKNQFALVNAQKIPVEELASRFRSG